MEKNRVHADASNFAEGVTKVEAYEQVLLHAEGLVSTLSVAFQPLQRGLPPLGRAALPRCAEQRPSTGRASTSWIPWHRGSSSFGPFQGKVACQTIRFGRGVCGTAAATAATQLVRDVEAFPGHIACDGDSKSEIVVPIVAKGGKVVAIIDIDCTVLDGFDEVDQHWLEKLAALLAEGCDW
ncbi:yebR [Verticillium alfalfae VaMs.102]|uniref:YebR n=1 Tax=Verticillium alfalfae (strain VaMs.102 / ATCC MYA-4576 / FGSC 10136) TaxID=526221 RepID=C9S6A2_VERA1|nr:yebR [Verticillium alfalfae VaMs.102]EEY14414.1 yebR [Verticillium alfalfae VaMs.102]